MPLTRVFPCSFWWCATVSDGYLYTCAPAVVVYHAVPPVGRVCVCVVRPQLVFRVCVFGRWFCKSTMRRSPVIRLADYLFLRPRPVAVFTNSLSTNVRYFDTVIQIFTRDSLTC
jgi:hypothetical protein